jgi:uncharacterized protein YndB with AHSA1/START domain
MLVMGMKHSPIAKAEILIRKPVAEVFEAFVDPTITARFWFTKGSGRLEAGEQVRWDWEMYDFSLQVDVKAVEENARILIQWLAFGAPTTVEWIFTPRPDDTNVCQREEQWIFRETRSRSHNEQSLDGRIRLRAGGS